MTNCKDCGHPFYTHHAVSGVCEAMVFSDITYVKKDGCYSYNTKACGCVCKPID